MMRRRKRETWVKPAWCVNKSYGHRASCSPDSPEAVSQASCRDAVRSTQCPEERPPEAGPLGSRNDKNKRYRGTGRRPRPRSAFSIW